MADILTTADCKTLLGITGTDKDAQIAALLPLVTSDIKLICNNDFLVDDVETYPSALKIYGAKMVGYHLNTIAGGGFQSETQGGYSYTKPQGGGSYPQDIIGGLMKWKMLETASGTTQYHWDERGRIERGAFYPAGGIT